MVRFSIVNGAIGTASAAILGTSWVLPGILKSCDYPGGPYSAGLGSFELWLILASPLYIVVLAAAFAGVGLIAPEHLSRFRIAWAILIPLVAASIAVATWTATPAGQPNCYL